jgi:hypothetical protein
MMRNTAIEAEKWYLDNADSLKRQFAKVGHRSHKVDSSEGTISIELEQPSLTATITVWSKGDIEILALKEGSQTPSVLADRVLAPQEDIPLLLDSFIRDILQLP